MAKAQVFNFIIPRLPFRKRNAFSLNNPNPETIPRDELYSKSFSTTESKPGHVIIELSEDAVSAAPNFPDTSSPSKASSSSLPLSFDESNISGPSSAANGSPPKNGNKKKRASFAAPSFTNMGFQGDSESTICPSESSSEDDSWSRNDPIPSPDTGISSVGAMNDSDSSGIFILAKPDCDPPPSTRQDSKPQTQVNEDDVVFPLPASRFGWNLPSCNQSRALSVPDPFFSYDNLSKECSRSTGNLSVLNKSMSESHSRLVERNTRRAYSRQLRVWADKERMTRSATDLTCRCSSCEIKTSSPMRNTSVVSFTTIEEAFKKQSRSSGDLLNNSSDSRTSVNKCVEHGYCVHIDRGDGFSNTTATSCVQCGGSAPAYQRRYKRARSAPPRNHGASSQKNNSARWVGVHHDPHADGLSNRGSQGDVPPLGENGGLSCGSPYNTVSLPSSPITPHIVVSLDEDAPAGGEDFQNNGQGLSAEDNHRNCQLAKSKSLGSCEDLGGSKNDLAGHIVASTGQMERHNSISSYLMPEIGISMQRKTRRNSMLGMMQRAASVNNISLNAGPPQLMRVPSNGTLRHGASKTSLAPSNCDWRREGNDSMISCLSALYGKILVVMGLAFPIGEFISGEMPLYIFKGFYLYLHLGSIIFLVYAYMFLLHVVPLPKVEIKSRLQNLKVSSAGLARQLSASLNLIPQEETDRTRGTAKSDIERSSGGRNEDSRSVNTITTFQNNKNYTITESTHESMYLKMGAMVFGIGSMIYSGLEVGQYFDLKATPECADLLLVVSPVSRMLFTFIQMYFIFLNSRVAINKHRTVARFGLMHMIATNLCIWLNVLVEETKHEIHSLTHGGNGGSTHRVMKDDELYGHGLATVMTHIADAAKNLSVGVVTTLAPMHDASSVLQRHDDDDLFDDDGHHSSEMDSAEHHVMRRSSDTYHATSIYDCRRSDMMSRLVDNASPFLFPCTIEYSLLCSGVLYVIWKNINKSQSGQTGNCGDSDISTFVARKARHHYSVDCAHATRGLFMGILVLVLTIISLILFFVLISNENTKSVAILEANIIELSVYSVAIITVVIGMVQMRELEFVEHGDIELDNILLLIAQTGTYIYTSFTIIGGNFSLDSHSILPFFTAVITLIQTTLQTLFILNASRRCCYTYDQLNRKPGREMVTFLLICNLAMWAISTFETSRADAHPTLLNYYGVWAWTIISHVSMPLAIFYRFHVTVCLCEIWKRSYKLKHDFL